MNIKRTLIIFVCLFMLCGCSNLESSCDKISAKIIDSFQMDVVDLNNLSDKEKTIFNDFLNSQLEENLVVNISENTINLSDFYEADANTSKMFQNNGEYYIKYKDITWDEYDGTYYAVFTINNMQTTIYKSCLPLLFTETFGVEKYNYVLNNKKEFNDKIDYYYKSIYDESGLVIRFHLKNNSIDNISLIYELVYSDEIVTNQEEKSINIGLIIIAIILIVISSYLIYKVVIKKKKSIYNQNFNI